MPSGPIHCPDRHHDGAWCAGARLERSRCGDDGDAGYRLRAGVCRVDAARLARAAVCVRAQRRRRRTEVALARADCPAPTVRIRECRGSEASVALGSSAGLVRWDGTRGVGHPAAATPIRYEESEPGFRSAGIGYAGEARFIGGDWLTCELASHLELIEACAASA